MICEELAAVTTPSSLNAGFKVAIFSSVVSGRMPSSRCIKTGPCSVSTVTGRISRLNQPCSVAFAARLWLSRLNSSNWRRSSFQRSARISALIP